MIKLGFIGLGIMGLPMAKNLLKAGYNIRAFDVNKTALNQIVSNGANRGESPKDIATHCDIILLMLPNSNNVKDVILGENGVIYGLSKGKIVIDMSSISPLVSQELAEILMEKGIYSLDAPVSGGQEKAENGTLAFMIGGDEKIFNKCKPIFQVMGKSITLVGGNGSGQTTKLVNQVIVGINIAAIAEALSLGKKIGINLEKIVAAIENGLAGSQCLNDKAPRMINGYYDPGFKIMLHIKDLANVLETSNSLHVAMPITSQVMEMMQSLACDNHSEKDHGSLALYYEKINNLSLKNI